MGADAAPLGDGDPIDLDHDLAWIDTGMIYFDTGMIARLDTIKARTPPEGMRREYCNMLHWGYARAHRDARTEDVGRGFKFVAIAKTVTVGRLTTQRKPLSAVEILGRIRMSMPVVRLFNKMRDKVRDKSSKKQYDDEVSWTTRTWSSLMAQRMSVALHMAAAKRAVGDCP